MRSGVRSLLRCGAMSSRTPAGVACYSLTSGKRASCARGATDATSRERLGKRPVNCGGRGRVPSPASHRPLTGLSPDRGVPLPDRVVAGPAQGVQNGGAGGVGRAAWRGRGEISGVAGLFKKKKKKKREVRQEIMQ